MNVYGKQNVDPSPRGPIPEPLPAGQLPPDDSPMWLFTPDAVRSGEQFIQADTIEWFMDRGGKVQVRRDYPDHPRWLSNDALGDKAEKAINKAGAWIQNHTTLVLVFFLGFAAGALLI